MLLLLLLRCWLRARPPSSSTHLAPISLAARRGLLGSAPRKFLRLLAQVQLVRRLPSLFLSLLAHSSFAMAEQAPRFTTRCLAECDPSLIGELAQWHNTEFGGRSVLERTEELQGVAAKGAEWRGLPNYWVAFDEADTAIGTVRLCADAFDGCRPQYTPWLATLYVRPEWRGHGVGTALIRACEAAAADGQYEGLYLYSLNERASTLYERLGWRVVERAPLPHDVPGRVAGSCEVPIYSSANVPRVDAYM